MTRKRIGVLAGTVLVGGLLLALSGSALANGPASSPAATSSSPYGWMGGGAAGGGMMGTYGAAPAAPGATPGAAATFGPGMMGAGGYGHMDATDVQQMLDWMNQAGPQFRAMHDAMAKSGCNPDVMKQFLASPAPTS